MRSGKIAAMRLEKVLLSDRLNASDNLKEAIKGDLYNVLSAFAEINQGSVKLAISEDEKGGYSVNFVAQVTRFRK